MEKFPGSFLANLFIVDVYSAVTLRALGTLFLISYWYLTMPKGIPPGPLGVPILGSLPFLGKQPHFTLNEMAKKYGQVFSVYLGSRLVIVLNDYEAMTDALIKQSDKFWSRPADNAFFLPEVRGVMPADDDTMWKTHRRFAMKTFRDFGVGKNVFEEKLIEEIQYFLKEYDKKVGKIFNPKPDLDTSVANNICNILFGKRFDYNDKEFAAMKAAQDDIFKVVGGLSVYVFLPWAKYIPGLQSLLGKSKIVRLMLEFKEFVVKEWKLHKQSYTENRNDDYTDAFIAEKNKLNASKLSDYLFVENVYLDQANGLFSAGMETTATLLKWCMIYMILYPEVQKKVLQEIDSVIGKDRSPQWNDRLRTPFVEATLMEIHRIATLVPMNVPHSNVSEAILRGYRIPKRSYIVSNLWNVHHDPNLWDEPEEFKPERFLNENNEIVKPEYFIPFSIGKHSCLGEGLARMETYLYFTSLLQKFEFAAEPGKPPKAKSSTGGLINYPDPFSAIIKRRK